MKGYDSNLNSKGKTPWDTLSAQLYVSVKDDIKSKFAKSDTRPKKFYLKSMYNEIDLNDKSVPKDIIEDEKKKIDYLEKDLHKYLSYFAYYHLNCYTKTINHNISSKKEFGEWVHPDMVGCYFRMED